MIIGNATVGCLIYGLKYGGAEKLLIPLAADLGKAGYRVVVIALTCGGPVEDELLRIGADVRVMRRDGRFGVIDLWKLVRLMKAERIEIVHTHLFNADVWGGIAARLLGIKHVSTIHGTYFGRTPLERFKQKLRMHIPHTIIAVSQATIDVCTSEFGIQKSKFELVHNGVDYTRYQPEIDVRQKKSRLAVPEGAIVLGTFGRLETEKGHRYLIEAVALIKKRYPAVTLLVIGEGSLKNDLMKRSEVVGVQENVLFLGERNDMPELLRVMDIAVFPSMHEGFSLAALEAMAGGRPVVATSVGGMPELIDDGKNGLLVSPGDPVKLAEAIMKLVADTGMAHTLALSAQERVRDTFTQEKMIAQTAQVYRKMLSSAT